MLQIGEEIELTVDKFADKGMCISRHGGFVIFIEGVIPGEHVKVKIRKIKKNYAEARVLSVIQRSPSRVKAPCRHFGTCGGCKWQHVLYECQLDAKRQSVCDAIRNTVEIQDLNVKDTIGSAFIYGYRTKMEFSFSNRIWVPDEEISSGESRNTGFALGLHAPSQFSSVIDIKKCHLQREPSSEILNTIREIAVEHGWSPWNCFQKKGYLKHLVIRIGEKTGEIMINLITESYKAERVKILKHFLQERFPEITTFVNSIVPGSSQNSSDSDVIVIFGPGIIHDRIGGYIFEIKPNAFFQPNTAQAEILYNLAIEYAGLKSSDIVYDLYCGTGTISIFLSSFVKKVVGIELSRDAVENAARNARINNIENCAFVSGDLMKIFTNAFVELYGKPDIIIVDPPRPGLHPKVVELIAQLKPRRLVYISCNPMSQMRDIAMLRNVYSIEEVQPVDMFPQTYHIESIIKLSLIDGQRD